MTYVLYISSENGGSVDTWTREDFGACVDVLRYICQNRWNTNVLGPLETFIGDTSGRIVDHFFGLMEGYDYWIDIESFGTFKPNQEEDETILLSPTQVQLIRRAVGAYEYKHISERFNISHDEATKLVDETLIHFEY